MKNQQLHHQVRQVRDPFVLMYNFFFSSRRRHTRFDCDWSSDVCSSDLFSTLVLVWTFRAALRDHLEDNLQAALEREARLIQDALPEDARAWDRLVGRLAAERGHRVTLLDSTGQPVADNLLAPAQ